jgi:hypothetical protein
MLLVAGAAAIFGFLLTMLLPEPAQKSLEELSGEDDPVIVPFSGHDSDLSAPPAVSNGASSVHAATPQPSVPAEEPAASSA